MADETKHVQSNAEDAALQAPSAARQARTRRRKTPIGEPLQHLIGSQLKAAYDEVVRQPVPDKFLDLLSALEANEGTQANQGSPS
jgi:hypothetical protein